MIGSTFLDLKIGMIISLLAFNNIFRNISYSLESMEGHGRVICGATKTIGLLAFIYLFYTRSFAFNPIKLCFGKGNSSKWNATLIDGVGVREDDFQPFLKSLVGDYDDLQKLDTSGFSCDAVVHPSVCVAINHVNIDIKTMEIYMPTRFNSTNRTNVLIQDEEKNVQVRPYAWHQFELLKNVTPVKLLHEPPHTPARYCDYHHKVPAVVFSSGGFAGNPFHEFNEIIIPLFITSRLFKSRVQFILVDYNPYLVDKYKRIFTSLSDYNILNPMVNTSIHCFPGAVVGLKFHSFLAINSSEVPKGNSILDFKNFLRTSYGLTHMNVSETSSTTPVLLLVSRRKTRLFLNEDEMVNMMEELGFEVVVVKSNEKMSNLDKFAKLVNNCSVIVGAHGAGLTNLVFLPAGAVVVQVVPLALEWASTVYFGKPAPQMGLHYLEYNIRPEESSLSDSYAREDPVISDPVSVFAKGYFVAKEMYLDRQNMRVDVNRFKSTLIEALRLLGRKVPSTR